MAESDETTKAREAIANDPNGARFALGDEPGSFTIITEGTGPPAATATEAEAHAAWRQRREEQRAAGEVDSIDLDDEDEA